MRSKFFLSFLFLILFQTAANADTWINADDNCPAGHAVSGVPKTVQAASEFAADSSFSSSENSQSGVFSSSSRGSSSGKSKVRAKSNHTTYRQKLCVEYRNHSYFDIPGERCPNGFFGIPYQEQDDSGLKVTCINNVSDAYLVSNKSACKSELGYHYTAVDDQGRTTYRCIKDESFLTLAEKNEQNLCRGKILVGDRSIDKVVNCLSANDPKLESYLFYQVGDKKCFNEAHVKRDKICITERGIYSLGAVNGRCPKGYQPRIDQYDESKIHCLKDGKDGPDVIVNDSDLKCYREGGHTLENKAFVQSRFLVISGKTFYRDELSCVRGGVAFKSEVFCEMSVQGNDLKNNFIKRSIDDCYNKLASWYVVTKEQKNKITEQCKTTIKSTVDHERSRITQFNTSSATADVNFSQCWDNDKLASSGKPTNQSDGRDAVK